METITLSVNGLKFDKSFTTVVTEVTSPDEDSSIKLDALPNLSLSLNGKSASSLKIEKDVQVTITPVAGSEDNSFTLTVGEKKSKPAKANEPRRSGAAHPISLEANNF